MPEKARIELTSPESSVTLRTITKEDIELLRKWKNSDRKYFFYNKIIGTGQQKKWYKDYSSRENDYIFMVEYRSIAIGCMGFRKISDMMDIYNVILGLKKFGGRGLMGQALRLLCSYIRGTFAKDITAKVLTHNPALKWYLKNNFKKIEVHNDFIYIMLDINKFDYMQYNLKNALY